MTRKETIQIFGVLVAAYPNYDKFKSDDQIEGMVNVWASLFAEDDAAVVGLAVKKHIMTSKWPPSIAEIRAIMVELTHPDLIPPDRAWEAVADLIATKGQYISDSTLSAYLPPLIADAVAAVSWHTLYELHRGSYAGNRDGMDRVAFLAQYEPAYQRAVQAASCAESINAEISKLRAGTSAGGLRMIEEVKAERSRKNEKDDRRMRQLLGLTEAPPAAALPDPEDRDD